METNEKTVLSENENISPKKKNNKGIIIGIIIAAVIVLAVGIGLGIYNSPENRMSRQLDLGQKYLEEQNYEQAVVAFNEVIEIDDRCLEAYLGGMEAYAMLGDTENQKALYEKALGKVREFSAEEIEADRENVVLLYLEAEAVYAGDDEKILGILQEGYELTGDERLESKIENLQAKIKEAEKLLVKQEFQEFREEQGQRLDLLHGHIVYGECYLTYEQIEKEVLPWIELLEKYKNLFPEEGNQWGRYLPMLYYMIGDYEACLDVRKQAYEITGEELFSVEGYTAAYSDTEDEHDEYGRQTKVITSTDGLCPSEREYGENGRVKIVRVFNYTSHGEKDSYEIWNYEYDNDGRVTKQTMERYHNGSGELCSCAIITCSYDNIEQGYFTQHVWQTLDICRGGSAKIYEWDKDVTIEQDGMLTWGEPYNRYQSE